MCQCRNCSPTPPQASCLGTYLTSGAVPGPHPSVEPLLTQVQPLCLCSTWGAVPGLGSSPHPRPGASLPTSSMSAARAGSTAWGCSAWWLALGLQTRHVLGYSYNVFHMRKCENIGCNCVLVSQISINQTSMLCISNSSAV